MFNQGQFNLIRFNIPLMADINASIDLAGQGLLVVPSHKYIISFMTVLGSWLDTKVIVIDSEKYTITHDGANAMTWLTAGEFFNLMKGVNAITFTDLEASRNIAFRLTKRDRWL